MLNSLMKTTKDDCYKRANREAMIFGWKQSESRSAVAQTTLQGGQVFQNETTNSRLFQTEIVTTSELQSECGNAASFKANSQLIKNNANTAEADIKG